MTIKRLIFSLPILALLSHSAMALNIPIDQDDALRNDDSIKVFYSGTADQYRIPSIAKLDGNQIALFAERRYIELAFHDFKAQNLILRRLNRNNGQLSDTIMVQRQQDSVPQFGSAFRHNLMNPTSAYDEKSNTLHLFYNRIITLGSSDDIQRVEVLHTYSLDSGNTWSAPVDITAQVANPCETVTVGPGRAIIVPDGEPNAGRIIIPMHTIKYADGSSLPVNYQPECSAENRVAKGAFKVAFKDTGGDWMPSNLVSTGSSEGLIGEPQIIYTNGVTYLFSRLLGNYEYDGSGLAYSLNQGETWQAGFNEYGPMIGSEMTPFTGRFYTPTQPGLATDGRFIYYTTSVHYGSDESISNRREGWTHRIDPEEMLDYDTSPVNIVQPISKTGFSNSSTIYLGDNRIGVIWEEVQTKHAIKRIKELFYTELDTRDFRPIMDPDWVDNGFEYHPTWNGSHHLLNPEILEGDKRENWNP